MSTDTTKTRRELPQLTHHYEISAVLADLTALGRQRLQQKASGGQLYATFCDFCSNTGQPVTTDLFELWLEGFDPELAPTEARVLRARRAIGVAS